MSSVVTVLISNQRALKSKYVTISATMSVKEEKNSITKTLIFSETKIHYLWFVVGRLRYWILDWRANCLSLVPSVTSWYSQNVLLENDDFVKNTTETRGMVEWYRDS